SSTWGNFAEALAYYSDHPGQVDGIGYVFSADDPFCGTDLDKCRNQQTGALEPWAQEMVNRLDTYAEVSPSSCGVKLWAIASKPGTRCKAAYKSGAVEMYDKERFFTVTGHRLECSPATIEDRQDPITWVYETVFGDGRKRTAARSSEANG